MSKKIPRIIVESPFSGNVERNTAYLRKCLNDSLLRGEAPYASHGLYTQEGVLNDLISEERNMGLRAGWAWIEVADTTAVYCDYGLSDGMKKGIFLALENHIPVECRFLKKTICLNCDSDEPCFGLSVKGDDLRIICKSCGYDKVADEP
jgi:hypothetical protein